MLLERKPMSEEKPRHSAYENVPHRGAHFEENGKTFYWVMNNKGQNFPPDTVKQWEIYRKGSSGIDGVILSHYRPVEEKNFPYSDEDGHALIGKFTKIEVMEGHGTIKHTSSQTMQDGKWVAVPEQEREEGLYIINSGCDYRGVPLVRPPEPIYSGPRFVGEVFGYDLYTRAIDKGEFPKTWCSDWGEWYDGLLFMAFTYKQQFHEFSLLPPKDNSPAAGSDWIGSEPLSYNLWKVILPDTPVDQSEDGFVIDVTPDLQEQFVNKFNAIAENYLSVHKASDAEISHLSAVVKAFNAVLKSYKENSEDPRKIVSFARNPGIVFDPEEESRYMRLVLD